MSDDEKRTRIREIEESLASLRGELGDPTGEPQDFGDAGADLAAREEQAGQIEILEGERERLLKELG